MKWYGETGSVAWSWRKADAEQENSSQKAGRGDCLADHKPSEMTEPAVAT